MSDAAHAEFSAAGFSQKQGQWNILLVSVAPGPLRRSEG